MRFNPHEYQKKIIKFLENNSRAFVIVDMGLGKTASTLQATQNLLDQFMIHKTLIIAPLRVAKHVWPDEIKKWGFDLSYSLIVGSAKQRRAGIAADADLYIVNRENVMWLVKEVGKKGWKWDNLVVDESSSFKSSGTNRFKALKKVRPMMDRCTLLTGTPAPNSLLELWSQVYLLDQGERLDTAYYRYRAKYFESDYRGYNWTIKDWAKPKIYKYIDDLTISMRSEDYISLPPRIDVNVPITLQDEQIKQYKELEKEFILDVANETITAANAAVLANKLLQAANGSVYTEEGKSIWLHDAKLEALETIYEESQGEPILVAYQYQSDFKRIKARFPGAVNIKERDAIARWNAGQIKMLVAHPASAGHGLNLQDGGHIIVWFGLTWSLELWLQFNKRVWRQGQTMPTRIYTLTAKNTIDEVVKGVLFNKKKGQDALIDYFNRLREFEVAA